MAAPTFHPGGWWEDEASPEPRRQGHWEEHEPQVARGCRGGAIRNRDKWMQTSDKERPYLQS